MPVAKTTKNSRPPRSFPPSLAGTCLRYAVMEVLGFGRLIDEESQLAMHAGSALHKTFQEELMRGRAMCRVEVAVKDETWGVSGRMDALLETGKGALVVEYKTVASQRFDAIAADGPLFSHWAQLQLYIAVGQLAGGVLVVDERPQGRRIIFSADPDPSWTVWLKARISQVKQHQSMRKLPEREISSACLTCDRWRRCFADPDVRDREVVAHPQWEPRPVAPDTRRFHLASDIVS
ncbi:MAG: hypothetical protein C7B45_06770 [Sulfobacillus acidophilus]|uniref:PD-(D/E)XK endonuclease-like domain-containing protein n=1 Tax=Sulfobacillus acidophilus TaxID=53633 RepID=A0A2T2WJL7_9FIRM|nr:MAG: hypothetical protein C7B45_06770 [Sulfobacillus acidophilus]